MEPGLKNELLAMMWHIAPPASLTAAGGGDIRIRSAGEYVPGAERFSGVEIEYGDTVYRGEAVICDGRAAPGDYGNCIMQVVSGPADVILKPDGSPLLQAVMRIDPVAGEAYRMLREGAGNYTCAGHIARMDSHRRVALFTRLLVDRLARKCGDLKAIYAETEQNWNETMYVMLMRTMGDSKNKEAFTELARRVRYTAISRERNSLMYVEAMLLGASGLLDMYDDDGYVRELKSAFEYLRHKYSITPMMAGRWIVSHNNPHNHPVLRIAQMATFLATREFLFDNLIRCHTVEQVQNMFRAEASQYWSTHFIPGQRSSELPKRIGHFKASMLGINLAVPMMFAFGDYTGDEALKERALGLLEKINCEDNRIVNSWRAGGVVMESAFDSQAILQLNNEFCLRGLCRLCPVGRKVMRDVCGQAPVRATASPAL